MTVVEFKSLVGSQTHQKKTLGFYEAIFMLKEMFLCFPRTFCCQRYETDCCSRCHQKRGQEDRRQWESDQICPESSKIGQMNLNLQVILSPQAPPQLSCPSHLGMLGLFPSCAWNIHSNQLELDGLKKIMKDWHYYILTGCSVYSLLLEDRHTCCIDVCLDICTASIKLM